VSKRRLAIAALVLVLVAAATPIQRAGAQELKNWRHGVLDPKGDAGFSYMIGQGFAEKQGLKLKLFPFKADTQLLQALLAGELDSFEGSPGNDIMAAARGADVKIIGCTWPSLPHVLLGSGVKTAQELKGKKIAVGPAGSLPDLLFRILLKRSNMTVGDVQMASVGNDIDRYKALAGHVVNAAIVSNEFVPVMDKQGLSLIAAARDFAPEFARLCIQATGATLKARPDEAAHFMAAEIASLRYAVAHRDETLALTRKLTNEKEDDPRAGYIFDWALKTRSLDPEVGIPVDKLDYIQKQLVGTGNLAAPYDVTKMIDASVREKALKLLGN
jgi:ABC-type nitrate/sulfonate/bicarbonate transport system substrate-binding protein